VAESTMWTARRKRSRLDFVPVFKFLDKFFRNVFDNLP